MMDTLAYILNKYGLAPSRTPRPTEIPNTGRDDLARLFAELGFRTGTEVGVEQGEYSEVLCRENPDATIYLVDPWQAYRGYQNHVSQELWGEWLEKTKIRLEPFTNWRIIRKFSMDAVRDFRDGELDFVYIDANHSLPNVINDIIEWARKIRPGGILSGHDFWEHSSRSQGTPVHVVYAVWAYIKSYRINPWFLWGSKQGGSGEIRDGRRSWMWVI